MDFSLVIPVYNEEENVPLVNPAVISTCEPFPICWIKIWIRPTGNLQTRALHSAPLTRIATVHFSEQLA